LITFAKSLATRNSHPTRLPPPHRSLIFLATAKATSPLLLAAAASSAGLVAWVAPAVEPLVEQSVEEEEEVVMPMPMKTGADFEGIVGLKEAEAAAASLAGQVWSLD
jgi:hypothetical protein